MQRNKIKESASVDTNLIGWGRGGASWPWANCKSQHKRPCCLSEIEAVGTQNQG